MAKRIRITFCGATGEPGPDAERAITVRAEATETDDPGVYAIDAASIVLDLAGNGTPAAIGPTFVIEDV